jgi:hypothetical protein
MSSLKDRMQAALTEARKEGIAPPEAAPAKTPEREAHAAARTLAQAGVKEAPATEPKAPQREASKPQPGAEQPKLTFAEPDR